MYEESFDPVLRFDQEHLRRDLAQDLETAKYREMLKWADFLIFIYPIWWSGMPALLKGFIDRVFANGFAYKYKGTRPVGLLKNKQAWVINTYDVPFFFARFFQEDYGRVFCKQVLNFSGISTYKHTVMTNVRNAKPKDFERFFNQSKKISRQI